MPYVNGVYVPRGSASSSSYAPPTYYQPRAASPSPYYPGSRGVSPMGSGRYYEPSYYDNGPPSRSSSSRRPSAHDSGHSYSRRGSNFSFEPSPPRGAERYEVHEPVRRESRSSSRAPAYNDYTGTQSTLGRSSAVRHGEERRYRPVIGDLGTYGGDLYENIPPRHVYPPSLQPGYHEPSRYGPSDRMPFSDSRRPSAQSYQSSHRGSNHSIYAEAGYNDQRYYESSERQPSYQTVEPTLRPGSSRSALRGYETEERAPRRTGSSRSGSSRSRFF